LPWSALCLGQSFRNNCGYVRNPSPKLLGGAFDRRPRLVDMLFELAPRPIHLSPCFIEWVGHAFSPSRPK
jgi:hypothetical protein